MQICTEVNCDVCSCAIDYEKLFDRIHDQKTFSILEDADLDDKTPKIIANLYWILNREHTEPVKMLLKIIGQPGLYHLAVNIQHVL